MATREEDLRLTTNLKSFKDVSKLGKVKLKQICKNLGVDLEKSFGKKALVNVVCNSLGISTSSTASRTDSKSILVGEMQDISSSKIPSIMELQKLKEWKKSLLSIPQLMDEALVKEFLLGVGYSQTDVRKYKTLRAWQHKQGIHSVKVCSLPKYPTMWALRGCCNPSFSTDPEETKIVYIVLEKDTSKPVYAYCSCTVGLRGDCSHAGALLFVLSDIVSQGKTTLPADPACTELPCSWSNPKGTSVDPIRIEQIHFYKSRIW